MSSTQSHVKSAFSMLMLQDVDEGIFALVLSFQKERPKDNAILASRDHYKRELSPRKTCSIFRMKNNSEANRVGSASMVLVKQSYKEW